MAIKRFGRYFLLLTFLLGSLIAQMTPSVTLTTKPDTRFDIILADPAHRALLPPTLAGQLTVLPPGSFLIKNKTDKAITALVARWTFTDADGKTRPHGLNTDAYYLPIDWTVVKPFSLLLVTPMGYATEDQFQRLASAGALDPLPKISGPKAIDNTRLASITVSVDSLIFEDGAIFGPDNEKYYLTLMTRRSVLQELSAELKVAKEQGEDFNTHLEKIKNEIPNSRDERALMRRKVAGMLQRHPEPEKLLQQLEARPPLPEFHHVEEGEGQ